MNFGFSEDFTAKIVETLIGEKSLLTPIYRHTIDSLNSQFGSALVGALAGALFGAWAAQRAAAKAAYRAELLAQISNTNAAISLAAAIVSAAIAPLRQHVKPMVLAFSKARSDVLDSLSNSTDPQIQSGKRIHVQLDLKALNAPDAPVHPLQDVSFNKLSLDPMTLALVVQVGTSYTAVRRACEQRNQVIERFRANNYPQKEVIFRYLGIPLENGHTDQEYHDILDGLHDYLDAMAFFGSKLCEELQRHAGKTRSEFKKQFKLNPPTVKVDFSQQRQSGLISGDEKYEAWLSAFRVQPKPQEKGWRARLRSWRQRT